MIEEFGRWLMSLEGELLLILGVDSPHPVPSCYLEHQPYIPNMRLRVLFHREYCELGGIGGSLLHRYVWL